MGWVCTQLVHMVNMGWNMRGRGRRGREGERERERRRKGNRGEKKEKRGGDSNEIHDLDVAQ